VPLRWDEADPADEADLEAYLGRLVSWCDVTVVDSSTGPAAEARRARWPRAVRVLAPDEQWSGLNGKVTNCMTGVVAARQDLVVVADDDVRYGRDELATVVKALRHADLVVPQNVPTRWPWWVWWESGRMLLNRAVAVDWPGTMAFRRDVVVQAGGWSPDVLFENLELARTVEAVGGVVVHRPDVLVHRRPPPLRHFLRQRVRQAYEEAASPARWSAGMLVLPSGLLLARRPRLLAGAAVGLVWLAQGGRRRAGGRRGFPWFTPLAAPLWVLERGVCSWVALVVRLRGGVRYHGRRVPVAAHSLRTLRLRLDPARRPARTVPGEGPGAGPGGRAPDPRPPSGDARPVSAAPAHVEPPAPDGSESPNRPVTAASEPSASRDR